MGAIAFSPGAAGPASAGTLLRLGLAILALVVASPPIDGAAPIGWAAEGEPRAAAGNARCEALERRCGDHSPAAPDWAAASWLAAPRAYGRLSERSFRNLRVGFTLAVRMVRPSSACRALFEPFDASGVDQLLSTLYAEPNEGQRARVCAGSVVALTTTGGRVTWLCPRFASLHVRAAALVLVHEALHSAGMPERPAIPGALASREINDLVERACGATRPREDARVMARRLR